METRNIALTLDKAKEWYNSGNETLKETALQAFTECELTNFDFRSIKTFEDAIRVLQTTLEEKKKLECTINFLKVLREYSSLASFKLNIIRRALNKGRNMKFTEGVIWYPRNTLLIYNNDEYHKQKGEIEVAKVKVDNNIYSLLGGYAGNSGYAGLGCFNLDFCVGNTFASTTFLGCATKEIAEHFGKYFAKEIFEAKYGDLINYEWVY